MESQADLEQGFVGPLLGRWRRRKVSLFPGLPRQHHISGSRSITCSLPLTIAASYISVIMQLLSLEQQHDNHNDGDHTTTR
ncbi:hypothetical protein BDZ89DRAFT_1059530 [Hymenopellis radicata]|nr:hypothetical protein BDZ89DRAFT_1059530 [Hymenopellis radicata]